MIHRRSPAMRGTVAAVISLDAARMRAAGRTGLRRLGGLSGREALERFIAAYVATPEQSGPILRAMTDDQLEEALSLIEAGRARSPSAWQA